MGQRMNKDVEQKLQKLNANQSEWQALSYEKKLDLLKELDHHASKVMTQEDWDALGEWTVSAIMGIPTHTPEGQFKKTEESCLPLLVMKGSLEKLIESYQMKCGTNPNKTVYDQKLVGKEASINGQIYMDVFPLLTKDKFGPFGGLQVQWWLDPKQVPSLQQTPAPFNLEHFDDNVKDGVMLVLGAGNKSFLTMIDLLEGLFVRNRTVLVKHHPLRGEGLDPVLQKLMKPLYDAGYLDSVMDLGSVEQNSALTYHPLVTAVHMTGGKQTHDAIVWGASPEEQKRNKQQQTPKLDHAEMTSELGCITPWIMVSDQYTAKQLRHHVQILIEGAYDNASSNCLAPKVVILDDAWPQKEEFKRVFEEEWNKLDNPVSYYPGSKHRWEAYQKTYPKARQIASKPHRGIEERGLMTPMMNAKNGDGTVLLPLLCIELEVDLTTEQGRREAKQQYAFKHEPFCPVVTFVNLKTTNNTIKDDQHMESYLDNAVMLCNDYIYGSLSCSVSVPSKQEGTPAVERAIANLKYGSIGVNIATLLTYVYSWGGHPDQECLDCVESGIGRVENYLFIPHVQKSVVRAPFVFSQHVKVEPDYVQAKRELRAIAKLVAEPGLFAFLGFLASMVKIPSPVALGAAGAAGAVVAALFLAIGNRDVEALF